MSFLDRFISRRNVAKELQLKDQDLHTIWNDYRASVEEKSKLIRLLTPENYAAQLLQLEKFIDLEIVDIVRGQKDEETLLADLQTLEHADRIKRVKKLEQTLFYVESKDRYVYEIIKHLRDVLCAQLRLIELLQKEADNPEKIIKQLQAQLEAEEVIIKEADIPDFTELFAALAKGEALVNRLNAQEKRLIVLMRHKLEPIFNQEIDSGIIYEWANAVFGGVAEQIYALVRTDTIKQHEHMDFEFVNRPEFEQFVRNTITSLRKRSISEEVITAFVYVFRDWYNNVRKEV